MPSQTEKYALAMAGEFFVAAQLQRLGISASVTYGNAKRADVVAVAASGKALAIEVKTSRRGRWPVGSRVPQPSKQLWVFVDLPTVSTEPPKYFVLPQDILHSLLAPLEAAYMRRFRAKHGVPYGDKPGVAAATRVVLEPYRDNWNAILSRLEA